MNIAPELMRNSLDLLILSALMEEPSYGYRLLKRLRVSSEGLLKVHTGTMYEILYRFEGQELITSRWDTSGKRPRKWYEITPKGRRYLTQQAQQWQQYIERSSRELRPIVDKLLGRPALTPQPEG